MNDGREITAETYERRDKIKRIATYLSIAGVSLGAGIVEAKYNTPYISKAVLGIIPIASAIVGAKTEYKNEYYDGLGVFDGIQEHGFEGFLTSEIGTAMGGGLSGICEAGPGLINLLLN